MNQPVLLVNPPSSRKRKSKQAIHEITYMAAMPLKPEGYTVRRLKSGAYSYTKTPLKSWERKRRGK